MKAISSKPLCLCLQDKVGDIIVTESITRGQPSTTHSKRRPLHPPHAGEQRYPLPLKSPSLFFSGMEKFPVTHWPIFTIHFPFAGSKEWKNIMNCG